MTLLAGLELNASRVHALGGEAHARPQPLALDEQTGRELALALSLENRRVVAGQAGVELRRRLPHLACHTFLGQLGTERQWTAGRHRLDAAAALGVVFKQIKPALLEVKHLALVLPAYLGRPQVKLIVEQAAQAKLPLESWISAPLAAAWAARDHRASFGPVLVFDVDDHALTVSALTVDEPPAAPQARLLAQQVHAGLGITAWKERLLNAIADRCINQSRRDPRASGATEQSLYDQLDALLSASSRGELQRVAIQSDHWYQEMVLLPHEPTLFCAGLVHQAVAGLKELLAVAELDRPKALVLATAPVELLPGLLRAVEDRLGPQTETIVLPGDALACAAYEIAARWHDGSLAKGPFEAALPLKKTPKSKAQGAKPLFRGAHRLSGDE